MTSARYASDSLSDAIFLDYEGNIDRPPTLIGWRLAGQRHAAVIDPDFVTCAGRWGARHVVERDHQELAVELLERAVDENRWIIGWSLHDRNVMNTVLSPSQSKKLKKHYVNALAIARPWHWHAYGETARPASLQYFRDCFGLEVPDRFGEGVTGTGLGLIRTQLRMGRAYGDLTPKARASWVAIVRHNHYDLLHMEEILKKISLDKTLS